MTATLLPASFTTATFSCKSRTAGGSAGAPRSGRVVVLVVTPDKELVGRVEDGGVLEPLLPRALPAHLDGGKRAIGVLGRHSLGGVVNSQCDLG